MMKPLWIDTHCHLDATELAPDLQGVRARAHAAGVAHCVIPAVAVSNFDAVRTLAHAGNDSYCLGIHPLSVPQATDADLQALQAQITQYQDDPRMVAVGEIGLDFFVPVLCTPDLREKQERFYCAQLQLAAQAHLPVVLHVRRSADRLLKYLRALRPASGWRGIAHAFNGSAVQAQAFVNLGFKLGFGGALTFERALQLRRLAQTLPLDAIVLETDAPDIPPHWLYATVQARQSGATQARNTPAEIPRIAQVLAQLRGIGLDEVQAAVWRNAQSALPKIAALK